MDEYAVDDISKSPLQLPPEPTAEELDRIVEADLGRTSNG